MIVAVEEVLRSGKLNYWTGEEVRKFEREFAEVVQCQHSVALANGTVALEVALQALGIGPGDSVVTSSRSYIASASSIVRCGARPVFADVDPHTQNITAESISAVLLPTTKAVVVVHIAGWACDMDPILCLAKDRGLKIIEDCAQAPGATYKGKAVGSIGDVAAFSFCQDKILTTGGEGGMLTTNSEEIWRRAWSLKEHGKDYDLMNCPVDGPGFRWVHASVGSNLRMTEMQAAIGRIALRRLPNWILQRQRNAGYLAGQFAHIPGLRVPMPGPEYGHSFYKFYSFVRPESLREGWHRDRIMGEIAAQGIPCFSGICGEIYLERAFPPSLRPSHRFPVASQLGESSLMFLVHPTLKEDNLAATADVVHAVMRSACSTR